MAAFWGIVPCSLIEVYRCFNGAYCHHHQGDETSMSLHSTINRPDDGGNTHL
jgi:hypothetical protein